MREFDPEQVAPTPTETDKPKSWHTHVDENGLLVKCYHSSRNTLLSVNFWIGMTLGYPFEHLIWEKLWPFRYVTEWIAGI